MLASLASVTFNTVAVSDSILYTRSLPVEAVSVNVVPKSFHLPASVCAVGLVTTVRSEPSRLNVCVNASCDVPSIPIDTIFVSAHVLELVPAKSSSLLGVAEMLLEVQLAANRQNTDTTARIAIRKRVR